MRRAWSPSSHYSSRTLAESKRLGIAPHEVQLWSIELRADELAMRHTPTSPMPMWAQKLAVAMIEHAQTDLKHERSVRMLLPPNRRPDPFGARAWVQDVTSDAACTLRWCCQVLAWSPEAVRDRLLAA